MTTKTKQPAFSETIKGFAIIIKGFKLGDFYATGGEEGRAFFYYRKSAVEYMKLLKESGMKCRVVPVVVTIQEVRKEQA